MNQPQIKIQETKEITCSKCSNNTFVPCFIMREVNRLTIGSSKKTVVPIEVMQCSKCFTIFEDSLPEELKNKPTNKIL
jgi:DNA-directed RNA polymerase subunit RPC12/RpoP